MGKGIGKLPESEQEIMLVIWEAKCSVNSEYISERLEKKWQKPTLLTLLSRLCERGFLECRKNGKVNFYTAKIDYNDYVQQESGSFLKKLHRNSLTSLVASLYDGEAVSLEDLEELKNYIEEVEE